MKWFEGSIAEAVTKSKTEGSIFVVYVEGKDANSQKLTGFLDTESIRSQLESNNFVPIKVDGGSETYMQFASIYQVVPVPSIFFIGKSGTPLEIATGIVGSVEELANKITKVLNDSGKTAATTTSSFIAAEKQATTSSTASKLASKEPTAAATEQDEEIVCEGGVCYKKKERAVAADTTNEKENVVTEKTPNNIADDVIEKAEAEARLEETRKRLEQKRRERVEEEKKQEKERELRRRREGKEMQNLQEWQKEQELKELKENLKRERLEEQAARERILAQIAADRAERAQRSTGEANVINNIAPPSPPVSNEHTARLQFRLSTGETKTNTFDTQDTLSVVRAYIKAELLPGTGIKDYILALTYPKREFTVEHDTQTLQELGLAPSAVLLVIGKEGHSPVAMIKRSGGVINMLTTIFWTLMSPVYAVFDYFRNMVRRDNGTAGSTNVATVGAQKRANETQGAQHDAAKRRNLDRFLIGGASTSKNASGGEANATDFESNVHRRFGGTNVHRLRDNRNDSDDENATWNGNSTQQQ